MIAALFMAMAFPGVPWWWPMMAEAAPANSSETITVGSIIAILGAIGTLLGHKVGKAQRVQIEPQPFMVKMQEEFVRREEFREFKAELVRDFSSIGTLMERGFDKVEEKHLQLIKTLELAVETGRNGRVALWNEIKPIGNQVAALQATGDVATKLDKLAEAIKATAPTKPARS